jgi:uncharacterized membrane protein
VGAPLPPRRRRPRVRRHDGRGGRARTCAPARGRPGGRRGARLTPTGVVLLGAGALVVVASGLWLIDASDGAYSLGDGWIAGAFGLLVLAFVLGGAGGQAPKRARLLAARLAEEGGAATDELRALLDDRRSLLLNYAAGLAVLAALVLMVWKP